MYVRCCNCPWSQDDFWSEEYNPFSCIASDRDTFNTCLTERTRTIYGYNAREYFTGRFTVMAQRIDGMKWWTIEEYQSDHEKKCPRCGSSQLTLD